MSQINITEATSPVNAATIDNDGLSLVGNTYTKDQTNTLIQTGGGWRMVTSYPAFTLTGPPSKNVILQRIDNYIGGEGTMPPEYSANIGKYFAKSGGFTTVKEDATDYAPQITGSLDLPDFTNKIWLKDSVVLFNGKLWKASGTTLSTDVPGLAPIWVKKLGGADLASIIDKDNDTEAVSGKAVFDFIKTNREVERGDVPFGPPDFSVNGYLNLYGEIVPNMAWFTTDFIPVKIGQILTINSYGSFNIAVSGFDENKQNHLTLINYPNDTYYNENIFTSTLTIERDGFIRITNRSYNGFTNFGFTINKIILDQPLFLTPDSLTSNINPDDESNPVTGKAVGSYIGDFESDGFYSSKTVTNYSAGDFEDNYYYNPFRTFNSDTKSLVIPVDKNEVFYYKGNAIAGAPLMIFKNEKTGVYTDLVMGWGNTLNQFTTIIPAKGLLIINLNKTSIISIFTKTTINFTGDNNLISYINKDKRSLNPVKETVVMDVDFDGLYVDVFNSTEGTTTIYEKLTVNALYDTGKLIYVQKGDKVVYTAWVGNEGLALYNSNGILIKKLLANDYGVNYVNENIIIPETGFIRASWRKSTGATMSIYRNNIPSDSESNSESTIRKTSKTFLRINKPTQALVIDLKGQMPFEVGSSTTVEAVIYEDDRPLVICNAKISWQGQSSISYAKKNFTFDLLNDANEKLKLKIGNFIASDSFHLKGFQKEPSMVRDNLTSTLWYQIRKSGPFPDSRIDNLPNRLDDDLTDANYYQEDARFFADGIPCILRNNGSFIGMYIFRLKKSMENYKMNKNLKTNIFLEYDYSIAGGPYVLLNWNTFVANQYEIKSPKMTGYVVGGNPPDTDVQNSIARLWAWTSLLYAGTTKPANTASNVVLSAWIDYLIACEISNHWDGFNNNILLCTHDGLRWQPYIYDTDHTWGMELTFGVFKSTKSSFILDQDPRNDPSENKQFWKNFRTAFNTEIKARYTELRNNGIISIQNIEKIALNFISAYSVEDYKAEHTLWGYGQTPSLGKGNIRQVLEMANASINYVDTKWKN